VSRTFTFAELDSRFRKIGEYEDLDGDYSSDAPSAPSTGTVLTYMDLSHRRAWEDWSEADEGWNLVRATSSLVVGSGSYALPSDFHRLRAVEVMATAQGSVPGWQRLARANADDDLWVGNGTSGFGAYPEAYRLVGTDTVEILPTPGVGGTLRFSYTPVAARISSSLQTCPGTDGFDEVVVYRALVMARQREDKDPSEFRASAIEVEARFRESIRRRDRSSPMRMRPRGSGAGRRVRRRPHSL
jgi:hypothetical protein